MAISKETPWRVILCGTNYGASYLPALDGRHGFALAGIVARGGSRSQRLARKFGVPLPRSAGEAPPAGAACVAGGDAAVAGEPSRGFLRRGVHVLCEHPVASRPMAGALALA